MTAFDTAFEQLVGIEGNYSSDESDPGNWTSGKVEVGECKGTMYGISAACLHPDTRVLMRDLTWKRNGDVTKGEHLIGFVKGERGAQLEPSEVLEVGPLSLPSVRITTNKRTLVASREHLWWGCVPKGNARNYTWMKSDNLLPGHEIAQYREPWEVPATRGAAWLAGIIDGEGCISKNSLTVFQNEGAVACKIREELSALGISWTETRRTSKISGKENIAFRLCADQDVAIGMLRPVRMLEKAERFWRGKCTHGRYNTTETVVAVVDAGVQPVVGMITSTGTFIAEGLLSHNSYPNLDIAGLTLSKAKEIYRQDFWAKNRCDNFPDAIAIALFKESVNLGCDGAAKALQRSLRAQNVDGVIGNITIGLATSQPPKQVLCQFLTECAYDYTQMANFKIDGKGWLSRVITTAVEAQLNDTELKV